MSKRAGRHNYGEHLRQAVDEIHAGDLGSMRAQTKLTAVDLLLGAEQREREAQVMRELAAELEAKGPDAFVWPRTVTDRVKVANE